MILGNDYQTLIKRILDEKKEIDKNSSYISVWKKWYHGRVPSFHDYYVYNGEKKHKRKRQSLHMAKKVCEDWASLLMNEKVEIIVKENEEMDKILIDLDFWSKANKGVEYAFALSLSALVVEIDNVRINENGELTNPNDVNLVLNVVNATNIIPITKRNGTIIECAFVIPNTNETIISIHRLNAENNYVVDQVVIDEVTNKTSITTFHFNSPTPLFSIFKPNIVNNFELDYDYPISIFGNSIDTLRTIDVVYDSYYTEFDLGRKRVYISSDNFEIDKETGEVKRLFDPNDLVIYRLPAKVSATGEKENQIQSVSDPLRAIEHQTALQDNLNYLSSQVGLGVDYYRFEKGRVMTATQVISEKSDTFRNMKKHEIILEKALINLMRGIMYMWNKFKGNTFTDIENVEIRFDDSIIEDKATEKTNDRNDVTDGVMSKIEYRMKWYGEDEETARKSLKQFYGDPDLITRINNFLPALQSGAMTYLLFVENVYPDYPNKEELAMQLQEQTKESNTISAEELASGNFYNPPKEE